MRVQACACDRCKRVLPGGATATVHLFTEQPDADMLRSEYDLCKRCAKGFATWLARFSEDEEAAPAEGTEST